MQLEGGVQQRQIDVFDNSDDVYQQRELDDYYQATQQVEKQSTEQQEQDD